MKKKFDVLGLLLIFLAVVFLSSFVLIDLNESSQPFIPDALHFVEDHKVLAALAVSETTGLLSKKVRGIIHGALLLAKSIVSFFSKNRLKA